jgi:hypothetical protein
MNDGEMEHSCWACCSELRTKDQKICSVCQRWQSFPWKYLNLSNAALAVVAALVSTGLTVFTLVEKHRSDSHFDFFIYGRSILSQSGNLNLRIQNYSINSVILAPNGNCVSRENPQKSYEIVLPDRFRLFPPIMTTHTEDRYFVAASSTSITWTVGEVYDCEIDARNGNNHVTTLTFSATVA